MAQNLIAQQAETLEPLRPNSDVISKEKEDQRTVFMPKRGLPIEPRLEFSTGLNRKSSRATEAPAFVISGFCPASHCSQLEEQLVHHWKMGAQICMDQTHPNTILWNARMWDHAQSSKIEV
jgi:hypothetical protein